MAERKSPPNMLDRLYSSAKKLFNPIPEQSKRRLQAGVEKPSMKKAPKRK